MEFEVAVAVVVPFSQHGDNQPFPFQPKPKSSERVSSLKITKTQTANLGVGRSTTTVEHGGANRVVGSARLSPPHSVLQGIAKDGQHG
jgi:hypothetical protein